MLINKKDEMSTVKKNIISFAMLKALDIFFPFIMLSLLVIKLGVLDYGYYIIIVTVVGLARIFISFGFEWEGTRKVLSAIDNKYEINKIFYSVTLSKVILLSILLCFVSIIYYFSSIINVGKYFEILIIMILSLLGDEILYSSWFYMSMQKGVYLSIIKITHRILLMISFLLISSYYDPFYSIVILEFLCSIFFGGGSFLFLRKRFNIEYTYFPILSSVFSSIKDSYQIFLSNFSVYMYSSINVLIISNFVGVYGASLYAICEKLYMALRVVFEPIIQALYPYLVKSYNFERDYFYIFFQRVLLFFLGGLLAEAFLASFFVEDLLLFLNKEKISEAENIFHLFLFSVPLALGGLLSKFLILSKKSGVLLRITILSMIVNLFFSPMLVYFYGVYGAVYSFIIVQAIQLSLQLYYYCKEKRVYVNSI